jgi:hypothetical protein
LPSSFAFDVSIVFIGMRSASMICSTMFGGSPLAIPENRIPAIQLFSLIFLRNCESISCRGEVLNRLGFGSASDGILTVKIEL